jgi:hypothetical protein
MANIYSFGPFRLDGEDTSRGRSRGDATPEALLLFVAPSVSLTAR